MGVMAIEWNREYLHIDRLDDAVRYAIKDQRYTLDHLQYSNIVPTIEDRFLGMRGVC